jgi:hypothetical protein
VGEHTDYGLLTLLAQDDSGGLQVAAPEGWIDAPPIPGTLVCNIGDMLDRLTGGWYKSTPHRVRNLSGHGRLSFPFFLDPGFADEVPPLPGRAAAAWDGSWRWEGLESLPAAQPGRPGLALVKLTGQAHTTVIIIAWRRRLTNILIATCTGAASDGTLGTRASGGNRTAWLAWRLRPARDWRDVRRRGDVADE